MNKNWDRRIGFIVISFLSNILLHDTTFCFVANTIEALTHTTPPLYRAHPLSCTRDSFFFFLQRFLLFQSYTALMLLVIQFSGESKIMASLSIHCSSGRNSLPKIWDRHNTTHRPTKYKANINDFVGTK